MRRLRKAFLRETSLLYALEFKKSHPLLTSDSIRLEKYFSFQKYKSGGEWGIRTPVALPPNGFQDRPVMTASVTLLMQPLVRRQPRGNINGWIVSSLAAFVKNDKAVAAHKPSPPSCFRGSDRPVLAAGLELHHVGVKPILRVERIRCAMMSTVLFWTSLDSAVWMSVSFSTSRLAVASSSRMIGASFKNARAMEMRWRSPPERYTPFVPMTVCIPSGELLDDVHALGSP